ncbi:hypothetical protein FKN01_08935 [Streptomyces sp. 130]|nr:hypothetical protein FKN01_08935 [Streptomyces sp. 130]
MSKVRVRFDHNGVATVGGRRHSCPEDVAFVRLGAWGAEFHHRDGFQVTACALGGMAGGTRQDRRFAESPADHYSVLGGTGQHAIAPCVQGRGINAGTASASPRAQSAARGRLRVPSAARWVGLPSCVRRVIVLRVKGSPHVVVVQLRGPRPHRSGNPLRDVRPPLRDAPATG